jgi:hypothetical protein
MAQVEIHSQVASQGNGVVSIHDPEIGNVLIFYTYCLDLTRSARVLSQGQPAKHFYSDNAWHLKMATSQCATGRREQSLG